MSFSPFRSPFSQRCTVAMLRYKGSFLSLSFYFLSLVERRFSLPFPVFFPPSTAIWWQFRPARLFLPFFPSSLFPFFGINFSAFFSPSHTERVDAEQKGGCRQHPTSTFPTLLFLSFLSFRRCSRCDRPPSLLFFRFFPLFWPQDMLNRKRRNSSCVPFFLISFLDSSK